MSQDHPSDGDRRGRPEDVTPSSQDVVVRPDGGRWWTPVAGSMIRGTLIFTVVGVVLAVTGDGPAGLGLPLVGAAIGAGVGIIGAVSWLIGPAQTTYAVVDGSLVARRRGRVRLRVRAEHITDLSIVEALTWRSVTIERMFSYTPFETPSAWIQVRTPDRWSPDNGERSLPSILLWGADRRRNTEHQLRQALGLPPDRSDDR